MISRRPNDCTSSRSFWPRACAASATTYAAWARSGSIQKERPMDLNRLNRFALIVRPPQGWLTPCEPESPHAR